MNEKKVNIFLFLTRKRIAIFGSVTFIMVLVIVSLYYFTVSRAESLFQKMVEKQSNGKFFLTVNKVTLNVFDLRFDFRQVDFHTLDSVNATNGYRINTKQISFNVHSLMPVLTGKPVVIDSVIIQSPLVEVTRYKAGLKQKISLPHEIDKIYKSLDEILKVLNLNYLHMNDAGFSISDRLNPTARPLQLSHINLTIDKVSKNQKSAETKLFYADRILLEIYNQEIVLPDGYHGIKFKRLWMGTRSRKIMLDSCYVYGRSNDSTAGEFNIFVDSLRISKLDYKLLTTENTLKLDSVLCINPDFGLKLNLKGAEKEKVSLLQTPSDRNFIEYKLKNMLGNLDIGYLAVRNADVKIVTVKGLKTNVYNSEGSNFSITGLKTNANKPLPLQVDNIFIDVHNYAGFSPDSLYAIQFDDIVVKEQKIQLNNFRIAPTKKNHDAMRNEIKMAVFELDEIDWPLLVYENRIVAGHATLIKPQVAMQFSPKRKKSGDQKLNPLAILEKVKNKVQINELYIEDGSLKFELSNGSKVGINNCYAGINVSQLLASENEFAAIDALDTLALGSGEFRNSEAVFTLAGGNYSKANRSLSFDRIVQNKSDKSESLQLVNAKLSGISIQSLNAISVSELSWGKAVVDLKLNTTKDTGSKNQEPVKNSKFNIGKITGGPTQLSVRNHNFEASTTLNRIATGEISLGNGNKPIIRDLYIDGQSVDINQGEKLQGRLSKFTVIDNKPSVLTNVKVVVPVDGEMASVYIPKLSFSVDISAFINGQMKGSYLELGNPSISFSGHKKVSSDSTLLNKPFAGLPYLQFGRISIIEPQLINLPLSLAGKINFSPGNSRIDILGIHSDSTRLAMDSVSISVSHASFQNDKLQSVAAGKQNMDLRFSDLAYKPAMSNSKSKWSVKLISIKLSDMHFNMLHNDSVTQRIELQSLNLVNLYLNDSLTANHRVFENLNKNFRITNGNIRLTSAKSSFGLYNLTLNKATNSVSLDSLLFLPALDRETFIKAREFQTPVYMKVSMGRIDVKGIDFARLLADTVVALKKVILNAPRMYVFKDKRLPFEHGVVRPMLTSMLLAVKPKISIDSLILKNGLIEYEEYNARTRQYGKIRLNKVKGAVAGLRTFNPLPGDSLRFSLYARLIDTADLRLKYRQSYTDSLSGFNLKLIASTFNLTALNPILRPFASAQLKSGHLDTIRMSVIGRKYVAYGIMKMYYHNLNAELLTKGDSSRKTVVTKSLSFFANRIVHTRNRRGTGDVYAERDPEKGFVNYWVKIVLGGVFTNTGVRTDKKQRRKYSKAIRFHDVPPIPDIPVDFNDET